MAQYAETDEIGNKNYIFGFEDTDAPSVTGFEARGATLTYEPETWSEATDGEGHTTAVARGGCKISASFSGYLTADPGEIASSFTFQGDLHIFKGITDPRRKGEFVEATLESEHYPGITAA